MMQLAWVAVDAFRPEGAGVDIVIDVAIIVTGRDLAIRFSDRSAILAPEDDATLLRLAADPETRVRHDASGLWADVKARSLSAGSFDRASAMRLRQLGISDASPALAVTSEHERDLIRHHFPELGQLLTAETADPVGFRHMANTFLLEPALPPVAPTGPTAAARIRTSMMDAVATVGAIRSLSGAHA